MKLSKERIAEILYKACEEKDADIGSINFSAISTGLNKHLKNLIEETKEEQKEEIRQWLIGEGFEGLAEKI